MNRLLFFAATFIAAVASTRIVDVTGPAQRTPLLNQTVNLTGLVTAKGKSGFWIQDDAVNDTRISNGLSVFTTSTTILQQVAVGDLVSLTGKVVEFKSAGNPDYLLLKEISSPKSIVVISSNNTVTPLVLGRDRSPPTQLFSALDVGKDGFLSTPNNQSRIDAVNATLQPDKYGLDFWASLQGQLVTIPKPVALDFPNRFGEFWVHGDWPVTGKNARGGLTLTFGPDGIPDGNPEAIIVGSPLDGTKNPAVSIGVELSDITGVVTYQFGFYYVVPTVAPVVISTPSSVVSPTTLTSSNSPGGFCSYTVGDYNIENFAPTPTSHVLDVANHIGKILRTPDIMFIQEVQDNSGPIDDGVVSANVTLSTLVAAIANISGVTYSFTVIDPVNKQDGGQPGGNIRQAYLYRPEKLSLVHTSSMKVGGSLDATTVLTSKIFGIIPWKPYLSLNPGRVDPTNDAWLDSRKPLAAMWKTNLGHTLFTVNVHFSSKGGSTTSHGDARPPVNLPVDQRIKQVKTVATFVESILAKDRDANIIVAGDFNEYTQTRSVLGSLTSLLTEIDEVAKIPPVERYTYVFDNNCEALDHMFVSPSIARRGADAEHLHVNNWAAKFDDRVSDHDPTVAKVRLC